MSTPHNVTAVRFKTSRRILPPGKHPRRFSLQENIRDDSHSTSIVQQRKRLSSVDNRCLHLQISICICIPNRHVYSEIFLCPFSMRNLFHNSENPPAACLTFHNECEPSGCQSSFDLIMSVYLTSDLKQS